ncbi:type I DNA topoisomerase [Deinococcus soli (ex Cha et al. 2016)]|uniref:DNA topoisomerase 1 n=2 Tax=Deinococcus soli (ex Cha et al. 2016) TaxID=1309411 RepID=A0AAE4BLI1_9DEIO|nr:type I DNA topoisomerase [Deinococcus soli (ex Cha et al. 2016)]MDR6218045.1 DNA topoisomerase-1 [Deinococcus soli (ex Cha et al. 2016)]MDR6328295.1 DNA topoisomerase-1 [Deinococcus soli (ex Cha et al. 2016)]MDR6751147.1 DNA topoisomerase-1 [Deinococcus soli (ex Cha et al. 2016)]
MATLVIVESPAKARKIAGLLGAGFTVRASLGHVRDLPGSKAEIPERYRAEPWANLGVNPDTFTPIYVVPAGKQATVRELRQLAAKAERVLFASDMDREGEAISYHLSRLLGVDQPVRMVFTEITGDALQAALRATRPLDLHLVAAQEARRVIDRLVGYGGSPLLWGSVGGKLSAGRVQSAALMLAAQREMARMRFTPATFWSIRADVLTRPKFTAAVTHVRSSEHPQGRPIARAGDYTQDGVLKGGVQVLEMTDEQARALSAYLDGREATVTSVEVTETRSRPAPPFITSTLQQAGGRLNLSAKAVMDAAQRLYEGGFITYMRTDSPALSDEALSEARREATRLYGPAAVPPQPRQYATRNRNAQEAHEAIRPAGTTWRAPDRVGLSGADLEVYTLIYQRTVASQMTDAVFDRTAVTLTCGAATLGVQGRVLKEPGFLQLLQEEAGEQEDQRLPRLQPGQRVPLKARPPEGKKTSAPTRFTEATLVQAMEKAGIGRPSTYAQTLATLQTREYVRLTGRHLAVTAVGLLVATYLARQVPEVVQNDFTATMEAGLDDVAAGGTTRMAYLTRFWTEGLSQTIRRASRDAPSLPLPQLEGTRLRATGSGPHLVRGGQSMPLPPAVIPADLDGAQADAIMQGTWTAQKIRPARARPAGEGGTTRKRRAAGGVARPRKKNQRS